MESIAREFGEIVSLLSKHKKKEDELFFPSAMSALTDIENYRMAEAFNEFDRTFTLGRYERLINENLRTFPRRK